MAGRLAGSGGEAKRQVVVPLEKNKQGVQSCPETAAPRQMQRRTIAFLRLGDPTIFLIPQRGSLISITSPGRRTNWSCAIDFSPTHSRLVSRALATLSLAFAWLCANGAVWDAMQVAAWGKMFADYSERMTVRQALRETFDPAKPCELCVGIAKAKESSATQSPASEQSAAAKFVLAIHLADAPVFANDPGDWMGGPAPAGLERTDPVPLPPPRV